MEEFMDGLLIQLSKAPRTQIDEDIIININKFINENHNPQEKYDFIVNIGKEQLNMISEKVGVGRITPFVKTLCDLEKIFERPK